jgi:hypothetical protein
VTIAGIPGALQIGQTAPLRAIARAQDGGYVDVTAQARWASSNEAVCQVSAAGVAESRAGGTATITASYAGVTGSGSLSCGYIITATVHENAPTAGTRLQEVSVQADGGPFSGRTFTTDAQGRVSLPVVGQPGFALYFKKHGYDDLRLEIFELPRQVTLDVALMPVPDVRAEWSGACDGNEATERFTTRREGRIRISATAVRLQYPRSTLHAARRLRGGGSRRRHLGRLDDTRKPFHSTSGAPMTGTASSMPPAFCSIVART